MAEIIPPTTDAGLLLQLKLPGGGVAWQQFVERYRGYMEFCCRKAGLQDDDVQEIASRILFALLHRLPDFHYDPSKRFRGYITKVIRNEIIKYYGELGRCPGSRGRGGCESPLNEEKWVLPKELDQFSVDADFRIQDDLRLLEKAFSNVRTIVEPDTWEIFRRTAVEGQSGKTVAVEIGKSIDAVYMAKSRTLKLIREEVARLAGK